MIVLTPSLEKIFKLVNDAGYKIYLVGGFVRDSLLNKKTTDYDLATNLPLDKIEKIIKGSTLIQSTGSSLFSAKILFENHCYEITNLRLEGIYKKLGYPSNVKLTDDIYEDLKRRDFTINSIAFSPIDGLIDPFNGQIDLKNKIIKTIKDPYLSYKEDPTRILRAFRFAIQLNFKIEDTNLLAIKQNKHLLTKLSKHQIDKELAKFSKKEIKILKEKGIIE